MAEIALTSLLTKLIHVLVEEKVHLLQNVRGGIADIIDELKRMRAFLRAAEVTEEIDFEHTVWVQEVRNVTYESEDVLDEFMCNLACQHKEGSCADPKYIIHNFMNLGAQLDIASTVQAITQKFDKIHKRNQRYSFKHNNGLEQGLTTTGAESQRWPDRLTDALFQDKNDLVGIEGPKKNKVIDMLTSKDQTLNVVSVVGMGGLGKTTLVKQVYDDAEMKKHFQSHAWINVSPTFKTEDLLKDIIQQLYNENKQPIPHIDSMDVVRRIEEVQKCLRERSKLHNDPLKTLEELPNLVHIDFLQVYNGEKLQFKAGKFQKLKILGIHECESLEEVIVEESSMPNLEKFLIVSCGMLKAIPLGIDRLRKLKELEFLNMPQELITTIQLNPREGKDYKRVSHIPDVIVTYTVDGNWEIERLSTSHQHSNSHNTEMKKRINDLREK
ncbi:hypothetical protein QQ045_000976 [Rhodiola kirilowii]